MMRLTQSIILLLCLLIFSPWLLVFAKEIKIGAITDMSGPTSDVGMDYAYGINEAISYVNDSGGINGKKISLIQLDYGYRIAEAMSKYTQFKRMNCMAILGWGTGDTEALAPTVARDQIPYVSASYSAHLCKPITAYNLFFVADYSTQLRCLITYWFENKWRVHPDYHKRKPKIVMCYMFASPYSSSGIKAAKNHADMLGFTIGPDQDILLTAVDTKSQIMDLKKFYPDVIVHTNTLNSVSVTLRDAYNYGLKTDHLVQNWGFNEQLPVLAGKAADGVYGTIPVAFYGQDVRFMDIVKKYAKQYHPDIQENQRTIQTIQAWVSVLGLTEALKRADKEGDLSGSGILHKGFETFRDLDIGLGLSPINITKTDHRPQTGVNIYQIVKDQFVYCADVDLKKTWPEQWENEWMGW
ncbi:MAG: ABC transporter substrate-binding protein [Desulfobacterales bacterium]|nr:ABC transporter substrate-binding protein [Desulfobacterales bacterium]